MSHTHTSVEPQSLEDFFGEPISVYTDEDAIEDGFIIELDRLVRVRYGGVPITRMTRRLFDDLTPFVDAEAPAFDGNFSRALASILTTKCRFAQSSPDNTSEVGDIVRIPPNLWLVRNESGGWTAMYPDEY